MPPIIQEDKTRFRLDWSLEWLAYWLTVYRENADGSIVCYKVVPEDYNPAQRFEPTFTFRDKTELQELMNALWEIGLRPNAHTITEEHFKSVQEHLRDMKRLVEKAYKVDFKEP